VKLLSLLTIETSGKNLERARELKAARIVKSTIAAHTEDGTLQYRGVNLLERLEPGCTLAMPKQAMIRSYSMRAEEMVSQYKMSARSLVTSGSSSGLATDRDGAISHADVAASHAAIKEVDEMAEAVDEDGPAPGGEETKPLPGTVGSG
jgi:hypothetical protein